MASELISNGGWCAPALTQVEITSEMIAAWQREYPPGGSCSECGGTGELLSMPLCPCPMCETDTEMLDCWHCDGTGVEPEHDLEPGPVNLLEAAAVDLPTVSVNRDGITWPTA